MLWPKFSSSKGDPKKQEKEDQGLGPPEELGPPGGRKARKIAGHEATEVKK